MIANCKIEDTVLVWTKRNSVLDVASSAAKKERVKLFIAQRYQDVLAVPAFLLLIEGFLFTDLLNSVGDIEVQQLLSDVSKVVVLGPFKSRRNNEVRNQVQLIESIDESNLIRIIKRSKMKESEKEKQFVSRLKRILEIYRAIDEEKPVLRSKTTEKYKISERTLRRDIEVIRQVAPSNWDIKYDFYKGYNKEGSEYGK